MNLTDVEAVLNTCAQAHVHDPLVRMHFVGMIDNTVELIASEAVDNDMLDADNAPAPTELVVATWLVDALNDAYLHAHLDRFVQARFNEPADYVYYNSTHETYTVMLADSQREISVAISIID